MPYVGDEARERIARGGKPTTAGELTYVLALVCDRYMAVRKANEDRAGLRYQHVCEVLGALEGLKLDLARRVVFPYEARMQGENGDIYTVDPLA